MSIKIPSLSSIGKMIADNGLFHRLLLSLISIAKPKLPSRIIIETYNVCNLKCKMCPYELMTRKQEKMSMELFTRIVDDAARLGIKEVSLGLYSEPLLDDLLFERVRYARSKNMKVLFVNNGTLLDERKTPEVLELGLDQILFSFDGATRETYEAIRRGADFETTRGNILRFVQERNRRGLRKPTVYVCMVLQNDNYEEVVAFKNMWRGVADIVNISPVNAIREDTAYLTNLEIRYSKRVYPCHNIWAELTVLSNGEVALCCMDYDGKVVVGDLTRQSIMEVWDSEKFTAIRKLHLAGRAGAISLCKNCGILDESAYLWIARDFGIPGLLPAARWLYYKLLKANLNR